MNPLKFLDPQIILALLLSILLSFFSGCMYGKHSANVANEAAKNVQVIDVMNGVRTIEQQSNESQNNVAKTFEEELAALSVRANSSEFQLDRLRFTPRPCDALPTTSPGTGKLNAAPGSVAIRPATGEVNLDGTAKQVKQLGLDLDEANAKIIGLQKLVNLYQETYKKPVE